MERIRIRPLAFGLVALAGLALLPMATRDADAGALRPPAAETRKPDMPHMQVMPAVLPGKENTNVIAQNDGSAASTIAMDIYTAGGVLVTSASQVYTNVPVGGTRVFTQAINTGLAPGFRGVGVVSSDQPFNALLVRGVDNTDGRSSSSIHNAYATGGTKISLPFVVNALEGTFNSRFAIANTGTAVACVTIEYAFKPGTGSTPPGGKANLTDSGPGGSGCGTGYPIPVNGQVAFASTAIDGAIAMPGGTVNAQMSATVTATGSTVTVGVDAWVSGLRSLGAYDGFIVGDGGDLSTNVIVPLAIKHQDGFLSQFLLSNPNPAAADVTITYTGNTGTHVKTLSIPANGTTDHGVYSDAIVPVGFVGAARITSTQPIAVVAFFGKMTVANSFVGEDVYAAINGVPADQAATEAKFPLIFRRAYQSGSAFGFNSWVSVTVADGSTANITIEAVNDSTSAAPGCLGSNFTSTITKQITGSFIFYQNLDTPTDNGFNSNPACFWGGMVVTSDKPIVAIGDVANDVVAGDTDGRYNAFTGN
ncbi:MAG: hypothetical protein WD557_07660 [Dehalococcoidia bacterium]